MTKRVAVVVVAYQAGDFLAPCLDALLASSYPDFEVTVVDNGGGDDAVAKAVGRYGPRLRTVGLDRNHGFAGGVNAAIASLPSAEVYALVNQDCRVEAGWLEPLVAALADRRVGIAGARLYEIDGLTLQHAGGVVHANGLTSHLGRGSRGDRDFMSPRDVDYVTGAVCAFRSDVWRAHGPFDEGYHPAYFEEVDFCMKLAAVGLSARYVPDSRAVHVEAGSSGRGSGLFLRHYHRSRMRFAARHLLRGSRWTKAVAAELAWLGGRRRWAELEPVLMAYGSLPGQLWQVHRQQP
jgi:GT2 family glycosyltransferase